jgi:FkbM family methyltransferase
MEDLELLIKSCTGKKSDPLLRNFFYNILFRNYSFFHRLGLFHRFWRRISFPTFNARTKLFGSSVIIPSSYTYPIIAREYSTFNNPYLELVYRCYQKKKRKLNIIDTGAAIGDTFLFIYKNLPEAVNKIFCIEGHSYFLKYLEKNTDPFPERVILPFVLSDRNEYIKDLVQIHESTASAQGETFVKAMFLDEIISLENELIDVLKIDVDGFDGKVLAGSTNLLLKCKPVVIFEFHPGLLKNTGNDFLQPFKVLEKSGYTHLLWFDKYGVFSHLSTTTDIETCNLYAINCLQQPEIDLHYDIIALPEDSGIDLHELSECRFAKNKPFPY